MRFLNRIIQFFRTNHNKQLQASGIVHIKTKTEIDVKKANLTLRKKLNATVTVTYMDGFIGVFSKAKWRMQGEAILKNCVIKKIEW